MKMHKTVATRAAPFDSDIMHQIVCRLGALPQTHWGAYIAPPYPLAGLGVGPTGNGKEGGEEKRREGRGGRGTDGKGGRPGMPKSRVGKPNFALSNINTVRQFSYIRVCVVDRAV